MKKTTLNIVSILLICIITLSMTPLSSGNFASARPCAANFLPNYYVAGLDTANEVQLSEDTADYITSVLSSKYPVFDYRNSICIAPYFYTIVNALQSYDSGMIYTKGHLDWKNCAEHNEHMGLAMYNGASSVWDNEIYHNTSTSKNVHSFIWHCRTGIIPQNGSNPDGCGYRGLPVAFTHNIIYERYKTEAIQVLIKFT